MKTLDILEYVNVKPKSDDIELNVKTAPIIYNYDLLCINGDEAKFLYRLNNKERFKQYYQNHKEKRQEYQKEYDKEYRKQVQKMRELENIIEAEGLFS